MAQPHDEGDQIDIGHGDDQIGGEPRRQDPCLLGQRSQVRALNPQPRIEHQGRQQKQEEGHVQGLVDDLEIAETDMSYPEAGCWPDGREGVGTDQKPEQMMMDELGQGAKREVAAIPTHFFWRRM